MSRYAVISDIHGNLHAFEAVLRRMATVNVSEVICLGDVVGYGPAPDQCLDLVIKYCSVVVQGNHDAAVVDPSVAGAFNGAAQEALHWTRQMLGPLHLDALNRFRATEFIDDRVMCIHDCPVPGPTDYVHDARVAAMAFQGVDMPICLLGHTHVPMVFEAPAVAPEQMLDMTEIVAHVPSDGVPISLDDGHRYICNPGSVGQPRDCDPRASFAVLDLEERTFTIHRETYDIAAAQADTQRAGLPMILANRLAIGA
ncbi:MAG: metallophosphoesterase family protein [Planctomycetota bacterium]|jgi:predicted phosphodiesterase